MAGQSAGELKTPVEHGGFGGLEDTQCGSIWVHVCVLAGLKLTKMDQHWISSGISCFNLPGVHPCDTRCSVSTWQICGGTEVIWSYWGTPTSDFRGTHGQGQDQQDRVGHLISPFCLPPFEVWKSNGGTPQKKQPWQLQRRNSEEPTSVKIPTASPS